MFLPPKVLRRRKEFCLLFEICVRKIRRYSLLLEFALGLCEWNKKRSMFGNGIVIIKLPSVFILGTKSGGRGGRQGNCSCVSKLGAHLIGLFGILFLQIGCPHDDHCLALCFAPSVWPPSFRCLLILTLCFMLSSWYAFLHENADKIWHHVFHLYIQRRGQNE